MANKIIRTICYFSKNPSNKTIDQVNALAQRFEAAGFEIQTKRICSPDQNKILELDKDNARHGFTLGLGNLGRAEIGRLMPRFGKTNNVSFNYELAGKELKPADVEILFRIMRGCPSKTFCFSYGFNVPPSSPYFPSATFAKEGYAIGLQATDLSEGCKSLDEWLARMKKTWGDIARMTKGDRRFLGIDSSAAPLFSGRSSLVDFVRRLGMDFSASATTDTYVRTTRFIKDENPKPVGLCGLMFPALEDFGLAEEYEKGNFTIERNLFLSLHSGLGIDTYPIGMDEDPRRVLEILKLVQALSDKYKKPLSARFVSDGKAKIGQMTDFGNQYLKDVVVRSL